MPTQNSVATGTLAIKDAQDFGPFAGFAGTSLENFVLAFDTPLSSIRTQHPSHPRLAADFVADVEELFAPGTFALFSEVDEHWTTPVDVQMEVIGATVLRRALSHLDSGAAKLELAAIRADLAQLKEEHAKSQADRKDKLRQKLKQLESRMQAQLKRVEDAKRTAERQAQTKVQVLTAKRLGETIAAA